MDQKYLIFVSGGANSNKFYKMIPKADSFDVEYGRVGKSPRSISYPLHMYWDKYNEKIRKGYEDQSHLYLTQVADVQDVVGKKDYKPIENEGIRNLIDKFLQAAARVLRKNYRVSNELVTQEMIDKAQSQIQFMRMTKNTASTREFNEELETLFKIIPREMGVVSHYLSKSSQEFDKILEREQDLLDVMATKVRSNTILKKTNTSDSPSDNKTILEAMGLEVKDISEKEEAHIKKMLGSMSTRYLNAYRVENPTTRKAFRDYHKTIGKEKKIKQLWHGSRTENWWSIINNGLKLRPNAVITGKMFGYGLYFANRALKSAGYTSTNGSRWANGNQDSGFLAIYDVLYGTPHVIEDRWSSDYSRLDFKALKKLNPDADCVHAKKGASGLVNDEIIVYKEEQTTIKYIVEVSAY